MPGRLQRTVDFEAVLKAALRSRSAHFAVHHLPGPPGVPAAPAPEVLPKELSTGAVHNGSQPVDDSRPAHWLGAVLPKRLARRAVTRNLLRRQIRAALDRHLPALPPGLWLVRLRAGFERAQFLSAASEPLRRAARTELDAALGAR